MTEKKQGRVVITVAPKRTKGYARPRGWLVKRGGLTAAFRLTKPEAVAHATHLAEGEHYRGVPSRLVVLGSDSRVQSERAFG